MTRQLIICCDGTNNTLTGGAKDTNVTKLCDLLAPDELGQQLYYDPGVGNPAELPAASLTDRLSRSYERLRGLAFGRGVYQNIADAYLFLMRYYQPGDQIFLWGFSRGAFTARSIGGLVTQFGLLRPEMESLVATLLHVYFSDRQRGGARYTAIRDQISRLFASGETRAAPVWFVGVWDTVSSVGAPLLSRSITASPTIVGKRFTHVRQALALDEYRRSFEPRPYYIDPQHDYAASGQSIDQQWFSGAHCDVGGGYAARQAQLSHEALLWLLQEAVDCQLRLRVDLLDSQGGLDRAAVLAALAGAKPGAVEPRARVHSATYNTPWWALAGLQQRDPHVVLDAGKALAVVPVEHPSVAALDLRFPLDTVWARPRPFTGLLVAALLAAAFFLLAGGLLHGTIAPERMTLGQCLLALGQDLQDVVAAKLALAGWQLAWAFSLLYPLATLPQAAGSVARAVLANLALSVAYGYLLARAVTWAFARIAGVRRAAQRPTRWLNLLGLSAMVAVLGDAASSVLTLALLWLFPWPLLAGAQPLLGLVMTMAALASWLGQIGCAVLFGWGVREQLALAARTRPGTGTGTGAGPGGASSA
jgi:Uncharacterized alpha/beta hydrolase domain (DUF2235)